ncbi:MAG: signal peptidase II [Planctomycetota bacterium]
MHLPWKRFLVVLVLVALDQWSKAAVFEYLDPQRLIHDAPAALEIDPHGHRRLVLVDPWFAFMLSLNPGAAFGRLGDFPHFLIWGRALAVVFLTAWTWRVSLRPRAHFLALVLVLAGAAGNLIDNLWTGPHVEGHPYGLVRDFLDVWFVSAEEGRGGWGWDYHFPTFNVADACITVGAILWIAGSFLQRGAGDDDTQPEPA